MTQSPEFFTVPVLREVLLFEAGVFPGVADVLFADVIFLRSLATGEDSDSVLLHTLASATL
ncbi:MAG: hypothetical protein V7L20_27785 [Nostoc sp.]|uniref:hypothetical protein n=1 Tax=Nostoc sp. TaxID=1180 RepID=UPI002FF6D992